MVYLEKIKVTDDSVKYYYYVSKGTNKGVLIYFRESGICRVEKFCEGDNEDSCLEKHRGYAFYRLKQYVKENKYPEMDMVAWG